jgi:hypothetical protein
MVCGVKFVNTRAMWKSRTSAGSVTETTQRELKLWSAWSAVDRDMYLRLEVVLILQRTFQSPSLR